MIGMRTKITLLLSNPKIFFFADRNLQLNEFDSFTGGTFSSCDEVVYFSGIMVLIIYEITSLLSDHLYLSFQKKMP